MSEEEVNDRARQATVDKLVVAMRPAMAAAKKILDPKDVTIRSENELREKLTAMDDDGLTCLVEMFLPE